MSWIYFQVSFFKSVFSCRGQLNMGDIGCLGKCLYMINEILLKHGNFVNVFGRVLRFIFINYKLVYPTGIFIFRVFNSRLRLYLWVFGGIKTIRKEEVSLWNARHVSARAGSSWHHQLSLVAYDSSVVCCIIQSFIQRCACSLCVTKRDLQDRRVVPHEQVTSWLTHISLLVNLPWQVAMVTLGLRGTFIT